MTNPISYGKQLIEDDDISLVLKAIKSDNITQGSFINKFEELLCKHTGAKYAVVVSSGTAALHIVYAALGLKENNEIITTPNTFAATSNAALYLGAKPRFVDINLNNFLINEDLIEEQINNNTKIITPIHYAGLPVDMAKIQEIAKKHNLKIVEDAAHAIGSLFHHSKTGSCDYSDAAIFSFHPVKHITTGEGGAILTNNPEIYEKAKLLRSHGIERESMICESDSPTYHEMQLLGYNYRMTDIQAALGIGQLSKLEKFVNRRREIAEIYRNELSSLKDIQFQKNYDNRFNSYHLFSVLFPTKEIRDNMYYKLKENNIFTQIHYMPVTKHPYYRDLGYNYLDTPNAYNFYTRELSLPMYPKLSNKELDLVIELIKKYY